MSASAYHPHANPLFIVEDNHEDYVAARRALERAGVNRSIVHCHDGESLWEHLEGYAPQLPVLILLDLNLPGAGGLELLSMLKGDARYREIPTIIFTTSDDMKDISGSYQGGANSYLQKPVGLEQLYDLMFQLKEFWFDAALLPQEDRP